MNKTEKYGYSVNKVGLPRDMCAMGVDGRENITGMGKDEVCWMYWMLKSIEIEYEYSVNGMIRSGKVTLDGGVEPRGRIARAPEFLYNKGDTWAQFEADRMGRGREGYDTLLMFEERDDEVTYVLSLEDWEGYRKVAGRRFTFMGRELEAKLWVLGRDWVGSIGRFKVREEWWEV